MAYPFLFILMAAQAAQAAQAVPGQQAPADPVTDVEADVDEEPVADVVVTGARERGSVPGDIQPEIQLRAADIRSYGVSSVAELLTELGPQVSSGRGRAGGRPVVLLNGRRISGFGEIRDLPSEAIERVDILPEEAALRLGYRADQRVVNFVLRRRFNAVTGEVQAGGATAGGRFTAAADANLLRISRDRRLTVNVHADVADGLTEADREITPVNAGTAIAGVVTPAPGASEIDPALSVLRGARVTVAGAPVDAFGRPALSAFAVPPTGDDLGAFRTLQPATRRASANATYSRTILGNVTASLNGSFEASRSESLLGLATGAFALPAGSPFSPFANPVTVTRALIEADPRGRTVDASTAHLGVALNGDVGDWRWSATGNYDRALSDTLTDTGYDIGGAAARIAAGDAAVSPFARFLPGLIGPVRQDRARSVEQRFDYEVVASGPVIDVPAGRLATTLKAGFQGTRLDADARRAGVASSSDLARDAGTLQASVDLPIASRRTGTLAAIGNLSLNGNVALERLSDYGELRTYGYGVNWSPIDQVRIIASVTDEDGAPTVAQLGAPVVVTPDARVFDFVTGESVDVARIDGGNRALVADNRRVTKIGLTVRPLERGELTVSADYIRARTLDPIAGLPAPTAAIEAAFPDRFTRDVGGRLVRFDNRPVNFDRRDEESLRWGFNLSQRIGAAPQRPEGGWRQRFQGRRAGQGAPSPEAATDGQPTPPPAADGTPATPPQQAGRPGSERGGFGRGRFGGGGGGGGGGGRFGGGGFGGTRLQLSAYHNWRLRETVVIRPGLPTLDLLDGDAVGSRGGQPRHEVTIDAGVTHNWLGVRLSGRWQSGTTVRGGTARAPTDLEFSPLTTINLRAFANLTPNLRVVREHPWLRGTRITLSVQNLFDSRLRVTDPTGTVPLSYQPDLIDPTGRTVRIGIRKLFF